MNIRTFLLLAFTLGACTSAGRPSRPGTVVETEKTTLTVDNRGFVDMAVYVVNGSQRIRIGLAVGKTTTTMTIPAYVVGASRDLQFLADPIGSDRAGVSDRLYVRAGDNVTLMIPPS